MRHDIYHEIGIVQLLDPADKVHADTLTAILDTASMGSAGIAVVVGALTGVDGSNYLTPVLQESDTTVTGDFTTVAAADIAGGFTVINSTAKDQVTQFVGYKGSKRYIRVNLDFTGTGISAALVAAIGIVGHAAVEPVTAPAAVSAT